MGEGVHWPFFYPCKLLGVGGRTDLRRVALHLPSCGHPQTVPCVERSLLEKGGTKLWYGLILIAEGVGPCQCRLCEGSGAVLVCG